MLVKLNPKSTRVKHYNPPVPVERYYFDPDTEAPHARQVEQLLWVPASLVSRFLGQFPFLEGEADELFSIGCLTVAEVVASEQHGPEKIGRVCHVKCCYEMEKYANGLDSIVKVSTSTRYRNLHAGKGTPRHHQLKNHVLQVTDSDVELTIVDACEMLGYEPSELNMRQKRKLWEVLK